MARAALKRLDPRGRFAEAELVALRSLVASGLSGPDAPEELFGAWRELPPEAASVLRAGVEAELRARLRTLPRGRLWPAAVRGLLALERRMGGRRLPRPLSPGAWAALLWSRPRQLHERWTHERRLRRWRRGGPAGPLDLLAALDRPPSWLLGDYVEGVAVDPRVLGFRADRDRGAAAGYLLGLDLVHAPDGVWCLEANLNAALRAERSQFYEVDPVGEGLLDMAVEHGMECLLWFGAGSAPLNPWLHAQLVEGARRRGIRFQLVEDLRLPRRTGTAPDQPPPRRRGYPPAVLPARTLMARIRSYRAGPDLVLSDKELFVRGLASELARTGDRRVRVPAMTREPGYVPDLHDDGLPNLVYKYPNEDRGEGVYFLRVHDTARAVRLARALDVRTGEAPGRFQPFICSRLLEGRRFYDIRSFVFVSPAGVRYLGGLRKEARRPLPARLDEGLVEDRRPFIMSGYFGNVYAPMGPEDEAPIRDATVAVGEALAGLLARGFQSTGGGH